ncbi:MAG TPA: host attachment protein [Xanthomonadaceae bacterium]|nr:host attachment protein [Xanthomonadaceae bacterium]
MSPKARQITWILVADAGFARVFRVTQSPPYLEEIVDFMEQGRQDPKGTGYTDRPGRVQESANSARHGMEPRTDEKDLRAERFAREIGDHLIDAQRQDRFQRLVLVAPPRFQARLDAALAKPVGGCVVHREPKDLIHEGVNELYRRLQSRL